MDLSLPPLYDNEINQIALQLNLYDYGYIDCFPINKIVNVVNYVKEQEPFSFIYNTDQEGKPGEHWITVCYDCANKSLYHYDSYGYPPKTIVENQLMDLLHKLNVPKIKYKINRIPIQKDKYNCGYHCLNFLYQLLVCQHKFKDITGYTSDKDIYKFALGLKKFGYI